jgi:hypothetical protein
MKSATLPGFWECYQRLDQNTQRQARKVFDLWSQNPFHPSLHFKCINPAENTWAVRITRGYRAIGLWEGDTLTWFWIGRHDEYERYFG